MATNPSDALRLLAEAAALRAEEHNQYSPNPLCSQEEENEECDSPILDSFIESGGGASVLHMTNFSLSEFMDIWARLSDHAHSHWNTGRGKRTDKSAKDCFFMLLTVCKHGGAWDFLGRMFNTKGPTFERLMVKFLDVMFAAAGKAYIGRLNEHYSMRRMLEKGRGFKTYKLARYATDVTFHQTNRPAGNHEESKKYFSGKHKLYGYKTEVSVLPNGLAILVSPHVPGSVSDIDILHRMKDEHETRLEKDTAGSDLPDVLPLVDRYPNMWAMLLDKGYQGVDNFLRGIHPRKKPRNGHLSASEVADNVKLSSDRIIVENFFGRQCSLWGLMANKWRWSEELYDRFNAFTIAMTNAHVLRHPLRAEDQTFYHRVQQRRHAIGRERAEKRRVEQANYRAKRKRRMDVEFRVAPGDYAEGAGAMAWE